MSPTLDAVLSKKWDYREGDLMEKVSGRREGRSTVGKGGQNLAG